LAFSKGNPFGVTIAQDTDGKAKGDLFWDDGESINTIGSGNFFYGTFTFEDVCTLGRRIIRNNYLHSYLGHVEPRNNL